MARTLGRLLRLAPGCNSVGLHRRHRLVCPHRSGRPIPGGARLRGQLASRRVSERSLDTNSAFYRGDLGGTIRSRHPDRGHLPDGYENDRAQVHRAIRRGARMAYRYANAWHRYAAYFARTRHRPVVAVRDLVGVGTRPNRSGTHSRYTAQGRPVNWRDRARSSSGAQWRAELSPRAHPDSRLSIVMRRIHRAYVGVVRLQSCRYSSCRCWAQPPLPSSRHPSPPR